MGKVKTLFQENKSSRSLIEKSIINTADGGALVGLSKGLPLPQLSFPSLSVKKLQLGARFFMAFNWL